MLNQLKKNKFQFFIVKASLLYGTCYFLYEFILKRATKGDQLFVRQIINLCRWIFDQMGYKTFASRDVNDMQVFALIANYNYYYLDFNHTYTFTFIAYSVVFGLWMLWVNKFSKTKKPFEN